MSPVTNDLAQRNALDGFSTHDGALRLPLDPDVLLTEQQTAILLGVSVRGLQGWRLRGGGPQYVKCGRLVRYRRCDLLHWMDARTVCNTSMDVGNE